jgi:GTP pyrophosphokinase
MAGIKAELEDLAFKFLEPDDYRELVAQVSSKRAVREQTILKLKTPLETELRRASIEQFEVTGRPKHLWSIFQKMRKRNKGFDEIYDLMAIRVIVRSVPDCYHVLGIIHHNWTPIQERIKDYIASPKSNAYQSLHTTIFGPGGQLFEVQIRTQEMHRTAEYGIAAHWLYKRDGKPDELDHHLGWFRQLLELQQDTHSPEEFLEFLKVDLYQDEIFVFTPHGDVKRLPKGSTPIDFAFHVHTEVGLKCQGAKINGRIAPLHRELKSGDTIEILTGAGAKPSRDWLSHVRTARARHKIKQWVNHEEETVSLALGREILVREVRRRRLENPDDARLAKAAATLSLADGRGLEIAVGRGDVNIGQVMKALYPDLPSDEIQEPKPTVFGRVIDRIRLGRGIKIQGVDGLMVRYAQCCQPVPGDPVVGYVTQGRGISIHRSDCPNLLTLAADERRVDIDWQETAGEAFAVRLAVSGEDRRGLYADIMEAVSQTGTNIRGADLHTKDGSVFGTIFVEVDNLPHLGKVMKAVRKVKGVTEIERRDSPAN